MCVLPYISPDTAYRNVTVVSAWLKICNHLSVETLAKASRNSKVTALALSPAK